MELCYLCSETLKCSHEDEVDSIPDPYAQKNVYGILGTEPGSSWTAFRHSNQLYYRDILIYFNPIQILL